MTSITRWDPFAGALALRDEFDRILGRPHASAGPASVPWRPVSDVYETDGALVLTAELPGVKDEDIDISIDDGVLTITGERRLHDEVREGGVYRMERSYGGFSRGFRLPPGTRPEDVKASVAYGVLRVEIPKPAGTQPHRVAVTPAG